jgi:hypothetical protein
VQYNTNSSLKMKCILPVLYITANMLLMASSSVKAHYLFTAAIGSAHEREARRMQQGTCIRTVHNWYDCPETQFCGTDHQCHDYSCPAWFQKGGWNDDAEISIGNNTTTLLTCEDYYSNNNGDGKYAVVFGCGFYLGVIPAGEGYGLPLNRKCSATIGMQRLDCYDLKPNTDFSSFLSQVDSATTPHQNCTNSTDGSEYSPSFIYQVSLTLSNGESILGTPGVTSTFKESLAAFTMHAIATNLTTSLAPTQSPTEASPTTTISPTSSGVPMIRPSSYTTAASVGLVVFLFWNLFM